MDPEQRGEQARRYFVRRIAWRWLVGLGLLAVAFTGWTTLASGGSIGPVLTVLALLALLVLLAIYVQVRGPSYLEGTILTQRGLLRTRRADLSSATRVRLRPNYSGHARLLVRDASKRSAEESLLTITGLVTFAQPPELLDAIGRALETAPDGYASGVRAVLAMQADHLRRGGAPAKSPLRPLTSQALMNAGEAGALLSILGHID